ncbi:MAG: hypothetical protein JWO60_2901 [Frankiales bacterium]|nr:hypothetical protein [Frankiales bacterium]
MPRSLPRLLSTALALVTVLVALGATLLLTGRNAVVVTHGVSMNPVYHQGDLVVVQRRPSYAEGDIVAYHRPDLDLVVLHRIVGGGPGGWLLQGDNNQSIDPTRPTRDQLLGRAVVHVPRGGLWLHRLTAPPLLAASVPLLLLGGTAATRTRRRRRKDLRAMPPRHRAHSQPSLGSVPAALRPVVAGAAVVGLVGLTLTALAWTRPSSHVVEAARSTTSSMQFSYVAHVPRSAAYDGTTVTAPQPVFRRLTDQVDVTYSYAGPPGALEVSAELSTSGGWTTSLPLGRATVGRTHHGTAHLDLTALSSRAEAAARATGLPAGEVTVALVPRVSVDGGATFAPRFALSLTDLVLRPTGDLGAQERARSTGSRVEAARLSALGTSISVSAARSFGGAALLLALLVAGCLGGLARGTGPRAEADRVRARYGPLILPVLPVALVGGRPVVDVPDVDSLARLAERYGLLVLHWSRGGTDTYVVQDEGTTFRYRTGAAAEPDQADPQQADVDQAGPAASGAVLRAT